MEGVIFSLIDQHELPLHNTYILSIIHNINLAMLVEDDINGLKDTN